MAGVGLRCTTMKIQSAAQSADFPCSKSAGEKFHKRLRVFSLHLRFVPTVTLNRVKDQHLALRDNIAFPRGNGDRIGFQGPNPVASVGPGHR